MRSYSDFEYVPSIMLPMFLFSGTFYPVSSYGDWAWLAQLSPLYHGVVVVRGLNLGGVVVDLHPPPRGVGGDGVGRRVSNSKKDRHPPPQVGEIRFPLCGRDYDDVRRLHCRQTISSILWQG